MKRTLFCLALLAATASALRPLAQQRVEKIVSKPRREVAVFLGASQLSGGVIPDRVFDSLVRQPLVARDSAGRAAHISAFTITFAERTLAEDSAGNPILALDYHSENSLGDTLSTLYKNVLPDRTKPGDTVWFERIRVSTAAGEMGGKAMKFVLTR